MRAMFHPQGFRPFVVNWDDFLVHLLQRLHREAIAEGESEQSKALLDELMGYPGIAEVWQPSARTTQNTMLLTVHLKREDLELEFFSTIATLGTPYDITLQELRIECLRPYSGYSVLEWLQVHPKWARRGIGSTLVKTMLDQSPKPVYVDSAVRAIKFYTRLGFHKIHFKELSPDAQKHFSLRGIATLLVHEEIHD